VCLDQKIWQPCCATEILSANDLKLSSLLVCGCLCSGIEAGLICILRAKCDIKPARNQGCQILLDTIYQSGGKCTKLPLNYHVAIKYTQRLYYIPNGHRIYQLFPFQGPPKFTQIGIFGLKTNHLATLLGTRNR
jgi:hypothetical protein